ncbi:MAG TPA: galactokinase [Candidatus Methylacidiphilales bacterium]|nr:galactokinase [Candidatus Methylacidiphilales bacterium]
MTSKIISHAPGRAEILGNHTDYNEGFVLALAVDRGTTITGEIREDRTMRIRSRGLDRTQEITLDDLAPERVVPWSRYALGVVDQFKRNGLPVGGFEAEVSGDLPIGVGLSSSASLEIAMALFLIQAFGAKLEPLPLARLAQMAEHHFVGVRCGLLDQITSLMSTAGHATFIDCRTFDVKHVPFDSQVSVIIADSGVKHALLSSAYNERRADCEAVARALGVKMLRDVSMTMLKAHRNSLSDRAYRRALHVVGENERVTKGCELLSHGDIARFGRLMFESHESSRHNFENSCAELDQLVEAARGIPGVYGARLSGGGFGGATINLVKKQREQEVVQALSAMVPGTHCLVTAASDGALARQAKQGTRQV